MRVQFSLSAFNDRDQLTRLQSIAFGSFIAFAVIGAATAAQVPAPVARNIASDMADLFERVRIIHLLCS